MRSKKAIINMFTNLSLQFIKALVGFVIPSLLITKFGSGLYGMTISISQFIGYVALLQAGVGDVIIAALYKPLSDKDNIKVSGIIKASDRFFLRASLMMLIYAAIIAIYFGVANDGFGIIFSVSLVAIISIGTIAQYMIGITYQNLLIADQRQSVLNFVQIIAILLNFGSTYVLVNLGAGIQVVKLISSMFFLLQPLVLRMYVIKKYKLIKNIEPDNEAIKQRWSGVWHTIAYYIHTKIDVFLITIIMGYYYVSIYSIYAMIALNLETFIFSLNNSVRSAFGNMLATEKKELVLKNFKAYLFIFNIITMTIFIVAIFLIMPFLHIYTTSFNDENYINPLFAYMLLGVEFIYCLRLPYSCIIGAAGHFRQTRKSAFIEASINVILSVAMIKTYGIIGVTIGTGAAMLYRTGYMILYLNKHILNIKLSYAVSHLTLNLSVGALLLLLMNTLLKVNPLNYYQWVLLAIPVTVISGITMLAANIIFSRPEALSVLIIIKSVFKRKKTS